MEEQSVLSSFPAHVDRSSGKKSPPPLKIMAFSRKGFRLHWGNTLGEEEATERAQQHIYTNKLYCIVCGGGQHQECVFESKSNEWSYQISSSGLTLMLFKVSWQVSKMTELSLLMHLHAGYDFTCLIPVCFPAYEDPWISQEVESWQFQSIAAGCLVITAVAGHAVDLACDLHCTGNREHPRFKSSTESSEWVRVQSYGQCPESKSLLIA